MLLGGKGRAICVIQTVIAVAVSVRVLAFPVQIPHAVTILLAAVHAAEFRAVPTRRITSTLAVGTASTGSRFWRL